MSAYDLAFNESGGTAPVGVSLAPGVAVRPFSVTCKVNGAGASGSFLLCLAIYSQDGRLVSRTSPPVTFAVGDTGVATFAPFLGKEPEPAPAGAGILPYCVYTAGFGHGDLWTVPLAGGAPTLVLAGATDHELRYAEATRDGTLIVFVDNDTNTGAALVRTVAADGSGVLTVGTLTTGGFAERMLPRWSPNKAKIAFTDYQTVGATTTVRLKIVNADGTGTITVYTTTTSTVLGYSWSADSSRIVFHADGFIRRVNADGTGAATVIAKASTFPQFGYTSDTIYYYLSGPRKVQPDGTGDTSLGTTGTAPLIDRYQTDRNDAALYWSAKVSGAIDEIQYAPTPGSGSVATGVLANWVASFGDRVYGMLSNNGGATFPFASVNLAGGDFRVEDATAPNRIFLPWGAFG